MFCHLSFHIKVSCPLLGRLDLCSVVDKIILSSFRGQPGCYLYDVSLCTGCLKKNLCKIFAHHLIYFNLCYIMGPENFKIAFKAIVLLLLFS